MGDPECAGLRILDDEFWEVVKLRQASIPSVLK